jgi:hypothetical protein
VIDTTPQLLKSKREFFAAANATRRWRKYRAECAKKTAEAKQFGSKFMAPISHGAAI